MPTEPNYSFLPWMRRGIAGLADAGSLSVADPLAVSVIADAMGEGKQPIEVKQNIALYGPGQVTGIDHRSIVRTIPRKKVKNFEANFLCAIEFYDEDFPWRYSPLVPVNGKLPPWLWVVALKHDEYQRTRMAENSLPAIEIFSTVMSKAFPHPSTTWAWAHTHLNFDIDGTKPLADQRNTITDKLNENANLGCSRLICPRHLEPSMQYTAFLIPAFEKGRLAGLGKDDEAINAIPNAEASWSPTSAATIFPVYYEWDFVTHSRGDFESLARLLSPLSEEESVNLAQAGLTMNISSPGWGLSYKGPTPVINCESALKPVMQEASTLLTDSSNPDDKNFAVAISELVNLGISTANNVNTNAAPNPFYENSLLEDDPIIVPPQYGSFYRDNPLHTNSSNTARNNAAKNKDWYNQLNLNPGFRVGAGRGTAVVQKDQETFMDRAWDQLQLLNEERSLIKRWHYSMELSDVFFNKRVNPVLSAEVSENDAGTAKAFNALTLLAPMHKALAIDNKSYAEVIRSRRMSSVYSASFNKITRPGGPLTSRMSVAAVAGTVASTTAATISTASAIGTAGAAVSPSISTAAAAAPAASAATTTTNQPTFFSNNNINAAFLNTMLMAEAVVVPPKDHLVEILKEIISEFNLMTNFLPFAGKKEEITRVLVAEGLTGFSECQMAFGKLLELFKKETRQQPAFVSDVKLFKSIAVQLKPAMTVPARLKALLPGKASVDINSSSLFAGVPEFPEPMYRSLAEQSNDFILPGLSEIPPNKVALLKTNPPFIESYMVGLNHEISREYLWREFPAPLNGTSFRQFWDAKNNPAAAGNNEKYKDIKPIKAWLSAASGLPTELGRNPAFGKAKEKMVVLVRGELLRKYPNTEIYIHKAKWTGANNTKPREPESDINDTNVKHPLFSAFIEPDYQFLGFDLDPNEAIGFNNTAGWYFVMKERAGDVHFGLDINESSTNPSWAALGNTTPENTCINVSSTGFKKLPLYPKQLGERADRFAKMLYQQPFQLFVHASRMVIKQ